MLAHPQIDQPSSSLPAPSLNWAVFFDIDGTLTEIEPLPEHVQISANVKHQLVQLKGLLDGALALVSGRNLLAINQLFAPYHFTAAGQHGLEIQHQQKITSMASPHDHPVMQRMSGMIRMFHQQYPELHIEYKGLSIAVHYRTAPELEEIVKHFLQNLLIPYAETLCLLEGKMVCEVKLKEADKGHAIQLLMQERPFIARIPVYVGDDVTDEDGFAAVNRLSGISIKVGSGPTLAHHRLATVRDVQQWLSFITDTLLFKLKGA